MRMFPVLCASGLHNVGTDLLLNFMVENFPAPTERGPVTANTRTGRTWSARSPIPSPSRRSCSRPLPIRSPAALRMFKVYSGIVKNDANLV